MVPHPYGTAVNCFRCDAFVEPPPRCSRLGLADWILRDCVRNPGDHFGLPLAQLTNFACTLVSIKFRSSSCCWSAFNADCKRTSKRGNGLQMSFRVRRLARLALSSFSLGEFLRGVLFCATKCVGSGFVEKNATSRDGLGDYALEYEPSHLVRRIRTAKRRPIILNTPT